MLQVSDFRCRSSRPVSAAQSGAATCRGYANTRMVKCVVATYGSIGSMDVQERRYAYIIDCGCITDNPGSRRPQFETGQLMIILAIHKHPHGRLNLYCIRVLHAYTKWPWQIGCCCSSCAAHIKDQGYRENGYYLADAVFKNGILSSASQYEVSNLPFCS